MAAYITRKAFPSLVQRTKLSVISYKGIVILTFFPNYIALWHCKVIRASALGNANVKSKENFSILRLCLVAVKCFPENTYFPEILISGKGKYFSVFGCISKNFPENIFWCLAKKKENTNPRKISSTIAI